MSRSALIIPDMRAACRERLLTLPAALPSASGSATVRGRELRMPGTDLAAMGLHPGAFATITGLRTAPVRRFIHAVDGDALTFDEAPGDGAGLLRVHLDLPEVAWQDEAFTPTPGVPFISEVFRRVGGRPVLFNGQWRHDMLLTLSLFWPSGKGTIGPESVTGRLLELYRPGVGLAYGANRGKVTAADAPQSLPEPAWTLYPVTIAVTAWTDN